jgi:integrase/recombinase XerD
VAPGTIPPESAAAIDTYLDEIWLERGLSENTLAAYRRDLRHLAAAAQRPLLALDSQTLHDCVAARFRAGYQARSSARWLSCIRGFYRHQVHKGRLGLDPSAELTLPKLGRSLPGSLSEGEVEALLAVPDVEDPLGLRDRAMLELFYSSGLRRKELRALAVQDLDFHTRQVRVEHGKGGKKRLVPAGQRAFDWVRRYLNDARPRLAGPEDPEGPLFVTGYGDAFSVDSLGNLIRKYLTRSGVRSVGSCHLLRHALSLCYICWRMLYFRGNWICWGSSCGSWRPCRTAATAL